MQLAVILGISDKQLASGARWIAEVSLMMPLCEALEISVNELQPERS